MSEHAHGRRLAFTQLDHAAIACAVMLSVACLAKGAVYDTMIAILMLVSMPILWIAAKSAHSVHPILKRVGLALLVFFTSVLLLQELLPHVGDSANLWHQVESLTGRDVSNVALRDQAAWMQGIGRFLFLIIVFMLALLIGSSESSARLFILGLLISGTLSLTITFFISTENGVPSTTYHSYRHGFVNPNNAAAYTGVMLLLALAQAARFFKNPANNLQKNVMNIIDRLTIPGIIKGVSLLFCVMLAMAGLFLTGSRAGIFLSLLCGVCFCFMVVYKMDMRSHTRKGIITGVLMIAVGMCVWSFFNFGQVITNKLETNGISSNSRFDIMFSVLPMIADHPLLGTGLGSFPGAFQAYRPDSVSSDGIIDKAHNSYFEFAAEMGLPAFAILMVALAGMGYVLYAGVKGRKERYIMPALGFSVWLLAALFSLIDFPLQIPGLAAVFIAITVVCVSQTDRRFSEPMHSSSAVPGKRQRIRKRRRSNSKPI